jgi:hypothetical protein
MKITINGETFDYDGSKKPMLEALTIEKALGMRYVEYEEELQAGSMLAMAGFIWSVLHRDGRDVEISQILDGTYEVDVMDVLESLAAAAEELEAAKASEANPTEGAPRRTGRAGTATTGTGTSRSSRSTTA